MLLSNRIARNLSCEWRCTARNRVLVDRRFALQGAASALRDASSVVCRIVCSVALLHQPGRESSESIPRRPVVVHSSKVAQTRLVASLEHRVTLIETITIASRRGSNILRACPLITLSCFAHCHRWASLPHTSTPPSPLVEAVRHDRWVLSDQPDRQFPGGIR